MPVELAPSSRGQSAINVLPTPNLGQRGAALPMPTGRRPSIERPRHRSPQRPEMKGCGDRREDSDEAGESLPPRQAGPPGVTWGTRYRPPYSDQAMWRTDLAAPPEASPRKRRSTTCRTARCSAWASVTWCGGSRVRPFHHAPRRSKSAPTAASSQRTNRGLYGLGLLWGDGWAAAPLPFDALASS